MATLFNKMTKEENITLRGMIVLMIDKVKDCLFSIPLRLTKDPVKRLEIMVWRKIVGFGQGGMASSGAHVAFKKEYYEKLGTDAEKTEVRNILLAMLKSSKYSVFEKEAIAYVCSDLGIEGAREDVALVREASARGMTMRQLSDFKNMQKGKHG